MKPYSPIGGNHFPPPPRYIQELINFCKKHNIRYELSASKRKIWVDKSLGNYNSAAGIVEDITRSGCSWEMVHDWDE